MSVPGYIQRRRDEKTREATYQALGDKLHAHYPKMSASKQQHIQSIAACYQHEHGTCDAESVKKHFDSHKQKELAKDLCLDQLVETGVGAGLEAVGAEVLDPSHLLTCCKIMHHIVKGDWAAVRQEFGMAIVSFYITAALCVIQ
jgi:hypothetical protein